jgi:hypothetical protein
MDERAGIIETKIKKRKRKQGERNKNLTEVTHKARGKELSEVIEDSANNTNRGNFYGLVRKDFYYYCFFGFGEILTNS